MPLGGQSLAGVARVSFEATGVGEISRDIDRVSREYREGTASMSDAAIKAELAQERFHRALRKGPGAAQSQANALLGLRRAERELHGETDATTRSLDRQQRELSQASRGALAGSGAFRGLGRSLAFASAGFLGGAGLIYGMRSAINVASNLEEQMSKTRQVFNESAQGVIDWSQTTSTSMGIARDQALASVSTYGLLFRNIGEGPKAAADLSQALVQLAADLASFNNTSVEDALNAIRSGLTGEIEPLRRYGVFLSMARANTQALADTHKKSATELTTGEKVLARYKLLLDDTVRAQGDYTRTADGLANSQRTLSALWRDAQGLVGQALAPAYTDAVQGLRDWLTVQENQEQLQRTVNALVGDAEKIVRGFAGGLRLVKDAASPVVGAMGGIENAVRAASVLWVAFKVKAITGFAATAVSSRLTATRMVADATLAGRAWDIATRPRHMIVTGGGVPVPGGGGAPVPGPRGGPRGFIPRGLGVGATAALIGLTLFPPSGRDDRGPLLRAATETLEAGRPLDPAVYAILDAAGLVDNPRRILDMSSSDLAKLEAQLKLVAWQRRKPAVSRRAHFTRGGLGDERDTSPPGLTKPPRRDGRRPPHRRTLADIELDIARPGNEMGDLREKRSFIQRQIDAMEKRGVRTKEQKDKLAALYGNLQSTESQIKSIIDEGEQKIADQREQAKADREEAREQAATRLRERIAGREETLANQQAAAELTKRVSDDRKAIRQRITLYREMGKNKQLEPSERRDYVGKAIAAQKELQDLNQKEIKAREDAEDKALDAFERRTRERDLRSTKKFDALAGFGGGLAGARAGAAKRTKGAGAGDDDNPPLTKAQLDAALFEYTSSLHGVVAQFGSNLASDGGGQVATHAYMQTQLMGEQNDILRRLTAGAGFSGTAFARSGLAAAGLGAGF